MDGRVGATRLVRPCSARQPAAQDARQAAQIKVLEQAKGLAGSLEQGHDEQDGIGTFHAG